MFTKQTYETMLKFSHDGISEVFMTVYSYEHGEKKVDEIVQKIEKSERVLKYFQELVSNGQRPSATGIKTVTNAIPYFLFSKPETLCLGCLAVAELWEALTNKESLREDNPIADRLAVDIIISCSEMKVSFGGENVFTRFFKKIDEIGEGETE